MAVHSSRDPNYEARVRASFAAQKFMATIGASLDRISPGEVVISLPFRDDLTQQHGFLHAGVLGAIADSACGYAALSLMEPAAAVLSVEYKLNLLTPAAGTRFVATGRAVRPGQTLTVCSAEVRAIGAESEVLVALMQSTMIAVRDRAGLRD